MYIDIGRGKKTKEKKPIQVQLATRIRGVEREGGEAKGVVAKKQPFDSKWGEEHPYDFFLLEKLYQTFPMFYGGINKLNDMIVGNDFFISSEDIKLKEALEEWMRDFNMDLLLRQVTKDTLKFGSGYWEKVMQGVGDNREIVKLVPRDPRFMFIRRDEKGKLLGYTQRLGKMPGQMTNAFKTIPFEPEEIAHFVVNPSTSNPYGESIIGPHIKTVGEIWNMMDSMVTLMDRKANSPIIANVGDPTDMNIRNEDIDLINSELQTLTDSTEWVVPGHVKFSILDFGRIGDKFMEPLQFLQQQIFFGTGIPAVLFGEANVPEGLAKEQRKMFKDMIMSIRISIEHTLKDQVLTPVAEQLGFSDPQFDFVWEPRADEDKWQEIEKIRSLLDSRIGLEPRVTIALQNSLIDLLGLEIDPLDLPTPEEEEQRRQMKFNPPFMQKDGNQEEPNEEPEKEEPKGKPKERKRVRITPEFYFG